MIRKRLLLAFAIILISPLIETTNLLSSSADVVRSQSPPAAGNLTSAEAQADFDLMRKALEEAHTGLYRFTTKAEMDKAFGAQRAKLNRPMTKVEFQAVIAEALARIKCGHTGLTPDGETQAAVANARMFPLRVLIE